MVNQDVKNNKNILTNGPKALKVLKISWAVIHNVKNYMDTNQNSLKF